MAQYAGDNPDAVVNKRWMQGCKRAVASAGNMLDGANTKMNPAMKVHEALASLYF